jgi:hypothetical protein
LQIYPPRLPSLLAHAEPQTAYRHAQTPDLRRDPHSIEDHQIGANSPRYVTNAAILRSAAVLRSKIAYLELDGRKL